MNTNDVEIRNVSDTALWVAGYRAEESAREHAAFRDPLAARLAGDRGLALARDMPGGELIAWAIALRTVGLDRLLADAIATGVDTVVNLGAGLDTRPYRMALPAELRWVEVDFPSIVDLKNQVLADEKPACHLERIALDLANRGLRVTTLGRVLAGSRSALVLTEGVLPYLERTDVIALAEDLKKLPPVKYWVQEYYNGGGLRSERFRPWAKKLKAAPIRFHVADWFAFFEPLGWKASRKVRMMDLAEDLKRRPPVSVTRMLFYALRTPRARRTLRERTGYTVLEPG
jgi:methyltransferase (TIGR00027 family)